MNWIKVTEDLPTEGYQILFVCNIAEHWQNIYKGYLWEDVWNVECIEHSCSIGKNIVTHWMYLPALPELNALKKNCEHVSDNIEYEMKQFDSDKKWLCCKKCREFYRTQSISRCEDD